MTTAARASAASASPTRIAMVATLFVSVPAKSRGAPGAGAAPPPPRRGGVFPNHCGGGPGGPRGPRGRGGGGGGGGRAGGPRGGGGGGGGGGAIRGPPTRSTK